MAARRPDNSRDHGALLNGGREGLQEQTRFGSALREALQANPFGLMASPVALTFRYTPRCQLR